jgi:hypothetical protein
VESFELEYIPVDKIKIQDEKIKRL